MGKSPRYTRGPIVKTGPTASKNRSRNQDGTWRKKRSDSGMSRKFGGLCFLTTAACHFKGLPDDCYQLKVLRAFRDNHLQSTPQGRMMIKQYYLLAPFITKHLKKENDLEYVWQNINQCVSDIETYQYNQAISRYRTMVKMLRSKFINE